MATPVWLLQALVLAAGLDGKATAATHDVPVFSAELSLVNVSVLVEDGAGHPIPGLTAKDFVLIEDGRRRPVDLCAFTGSADGSPSTALSVALLVDTSDSMLETLRRSQEAAVRFLTGLPNAQEVLVVLFDQEQRVERFDREHPEALFERLKAVPDGGNTALRDAIAFTLRTLGSSAGRSALVLFTDGLDTVSLTPPLVVEKAVQSNAVVIYPVAFPGPAGRDAEGRRTMQQLADLSGGRAFRVANDLALPGVLDEILADLRAQYVLGFTPDSSGTPGRLRKIRVQVPGHPKATIRHRVGYRLER